MAGYTRQSVADIVNGENITAPPLNAEFNQIQVAFSQDTGHTHDGSVGSGPKIDLTTSILGYLPSMNGGVGGKNNVDSVIDPTELDDAGDGYYRGSVWLNSNTKRLFVCMDATAGSAIWYEFAAVDPQNKWLPSSNGVTDLGSTEQAFRDIFITGKITSTNLDGTIGAFTPAPIIGTTITSNVGFYGDVTGSVKADDGTTILENGSDYSLAHFYGGVTGDLVGNVTGDVTGNVRGDLKADNGDIVLNNGATGANAVFTGRVVGNVTGNLTGDILSTNGTRILDNGADGDNAVFTGDVVGNLTGRTTGEHVGAVNADGNRVTNVANPSVDNDAINLGFFNQILAESESGISASLADAVSARNDAQGARDSSLVYMQTTFNYRNEAEDFRDQAANYAAISTDKAAIVSTLYDTAQYNVRLIGSLV